MTTNVHNFGDYEDYILWQMRERDSKMLELRAWYLSDWPANVPRTPDECKVRESELEYRPWSEAADKYLLQLVDQRRPWNFIASNLSPTANVLQCQIHLVGLRGTLEGCLFSDLEDLHLRNLNEEFPFNYDQIVLRMIRRPLIDCQNRLWELGFRNPAEWTSSELTVLRRTLQQRQGNWNHIYSQFHNKTKQQIRECAQAPENTISGFSWSQDEKEHLIQMKLAGRTFEEMAQQLPCRTRFACQKQVACL
ncbi:hypothetical protein ACLMJK_003868 [Lecanora helva]